MSMQFQAKINLYGFAVLLVPILMIKLLATILGINSPTQVAASSFVDLGTNPADNRAPVVTLTPEQLQCLSHVRKLAETPLVGNPLLYSGNSGHEKAPDTGPTHRFKLQMIMAFGAKSIAMIDNKQYRIGDQVYDSKLVVKEIRRESREVLLENTETGETQLLTVDS